MTWEDYELGSTISRTNEDITLWQTEKGIIEISKSTLAVPIKLDDQRKGYVFHGQGKLLLDAIVETEEGAVGKSVEKELNEPFLMLGDTEEIGQHLITASEEDLTKMSYENQQEFIIKAEDLCNRFFKKRRVHHTLCFGQDYGLIFAFPNRNSKLNILVVKGSKLVYKAMNIVFVSNENKAVLKSPDGVVVSRNGKLLVIKNNAFLQHCC